MSEKQKVLIVDDDKFLLEMYRKKFIDSGFDADIALGSLEALSKLRGGEEPDILVLDIIMPSMDGLELLENIRKENLSPKSKVVFLTNESDSEKIKRAEKLSITGYIVKATSVPSEVVEEVKKLCGLTS